MSSKNIIKTPGQTPSPSEGAGVRIKICGMKHPGNISEITALRPDYLGFIFYEKSTRFFNGTIPQLPQEMQKVGVFVNSSLEDILEKVEKYSLNVVQLHGEESPEFCLNLKRRHEDKIDGIISTKNERLPRSTRNDRQINIIKVFSIKDHFDFEKLKPYESVCDYFLFDTKGQLPGGNGYSFNWDILKNYPSTKPYFLSGGIGLDEVEGITEFLQGDASKYCHAIDVNSKFEVEPGLKDIKVLEEFKNKIKSNPTG